MDFLATGLLGYWTSGLLDFFTYFTHVCFQMFVSICKSILDVCAYVCAFTFFHLRRPENLFIVILSQKNVYIYARLNKTSFGMSHMCVFFGVWITFFNMLVGTLNKFSLYIILSI